MLVFGSVNMDVAVYAPCLPRPGETVHGDRYAIGLGGKGANQAVAAARLGADVHLVGRIGRDHFGDQARVTLTRHGVKCDALMARDEVTGIAAIGVDAGGQNCITVIPGANFEINTGDVRRLEPLLAGADVLLMQLELPQAAVIAAANAARSAGVPVLLDPAPAPAGELPPELLAATEIITPNETETEALLGSRPASPAEALHAAHALREHGARTAIVKLGARGAAFAGADGEGFVEAFDVAAVDSTAAGDAFNGALGHALAQGRSLGATVRYAAACGACATMRPGAAEAMPSAAEVDRLLSNAGTREPRSTP